MKRFIVKSVVFKSVFSLAMMLILTLIWGCGTSSFRTQNQGDVPDPDEWYTFGDADKNDLETSFIISPTVYFIPQYRESTSCQDGQSLDVRNPSGQYLTRLCQNQVRQCATQGTCLVRGTGLPLTLRFAGKRSSGEYTFNATTQPKCRYSSGRNETCLVPYKSVAADSKFFKTCEVLYIPSIRGTPLGNGKNHDGFVVVTDTGVKGPQALDFFLGFDDYKNRSNPFIRAGLGDPNSKIKIFRVKAERSREELRHYNFDCGS